MQDTQETQVPSLGREDPLEEAVATHSSVLAWRIPWTEETGGLQSMESQRVRHDWSGLAHIHAHKLYYIIYIMFSSVQSLSRVRLFVTPWTAPHQASLSITNCRNLLKLSLSIESVMPSNHVILCHLLLLSSIFPRIRVFSNK